MGWSINKAIYDILISKNALTKDMNFKITGAVKAAMVNFGKHCSGIKRLTLYEIPAAMIPVCVSAHLSKPRPQSHPYTAGWAGIHRNKHTVGGF